MKWIGKRISFVDDKARTTIVIYPDSVGWINATMGAWFAMWIAIGATLSWASFALNLTGQEKLIIVVFMVFWLYYAVRVGRAFSWLMWGKELLKIDEVSLTYKKSVKTYGKANEYYLENITKVRMVAPKERSLQASWESSPWVRGGERLEFDYMGKVIRFGRKLEKQDAELLFKLITKRIDERIRQAKKKQVAQ